ncbi:MAG: hypothetical protein JWN56_1358 [Sphingobacteriales bacterium]|nr:hypothetical protein [Sphingobacteriales bacterium]
MHFKLDSNTLKDLDIFSEKAGSVSIYSIFNRTRTLGGRNMLVEMMEEPSASIEFLVARRDSIEYFYEHRIILEITNNQLDLVEHYLNFNKRCLRNNFADAIFDNINSKIQSSSYYYTIETGINNILKLLKFASILSLKIKQNESTGYLQDRCQVIDNLMNIKFLKGILSTEKKLTCFNLNALDQLFRKQELIKVKELLRFVYEMDVFESAAEVVRQKEWSFPEYIDTAILEVKFLDLFHPAIEEAVGNNLNISGEESIIFLTGPNTAGKSSFLKATGLALYLAHIGFPVPAAKMTTSIFKGLITTINLPDNIQNGQSHYYSEVKRLKETALNILGTGRLFIIFDELFKGASPKDAYEASLLIITSLSKINNCIFIISTHIVELANELRVLPNISFKYFDSGFDGEKPFFTFKLKDGVSDERLGMYILKNEGVVETLEKAAIAFDVKDLGR